MILDQLAAGVLVPLAAWVLVSGIDDLILAVTLIYRYVRSLAGDGFRWPEPARLAAAAPRRIAIFVPLWRESGVIAGMLEHNIAAIRYSNYDFFIGAYPNDGPTIEAINEISRRFPRVHLALCPHPGPTSKADCLNWIYQRMLLHEEQQRVHYEVVVTHDAEDLIHPESLEWISYFSRTYDMVQVPVLPLPTKALEFTHGVYCDEFAEYQTKDIPARQMLGGFIPSNGVGTGYTRRALDLLAAAHCNLVFDPSCLTEDYENGYRIHRLSLPQIFLPIRKAGSGFMATREYFPRNWRGAVRQRTRWTIGISLQSWERHWWGSTLVELYWFWRDRKGLVGAIVNPLANLLALYGLATWIHSVRTGEPWNLAIIQNPSISWLFQATLWLPLFHMGVRALCVGRIYGWLYACGVPLRSIWGNWINCTATLSALARFLLARLRDQPLAWLKTDHAYPSRTALMQHKRRLGDILAGSRSISLEAVEQALAAKAPHEKLGQYLVKTGQLSERELYKALSLQQNLPLGLPDPVSRSASRSLPADLTRKWKVLPFHVASGQLYVAGPELPTDGMNEDLRRFTSFELRFHLVTPEEYENLARRVLPGGCAARRNPAA